MNHISLKKVTLIVSTCVLASYFVSAKENELSLELPAAEVAAAKAIATKTVSKESLKNSEDDFSEFLTKFDLDKNGLLTRAETLASKNELLAEHFEDIDQNSDESISKEELKSYFSSLTAQKPKVSDLQKKS